MKLANLILVHKNPLQIERLLTHIAHVDSHVFIHVDAECDINDFLFLEKIAKVKLLKNRINVNWGGYSIVEATLYLLKEVAGSPVEFDYVNLLSGQDYPIKPITQFLDFLADNPGKCFFNYNLPGDPWLAEAERKIRSHFFVDKNFKGKFLLEKILKVVWPKRKNPKGYTIIGRSAWFTIDLDSVKYILKTCSERADVVNFFKYCWGSDEMFFHSIIYNSPLKDKMVNHNYRYIDWSEGNPRPKTFTMADAQELKNTDAFFARKFDQDTEILNYIDKGLLKPTTA